jgi:hypothetical protein
MKIYFENAIRGGLSMITHKYAKANNPLLEQIFNPGEPNSYKLYQDCKYLYRNAMKMKLPHRNFQWLSNTEIESFNVNDIPDRVIIESPPLMAFSKNRYISGSVMSSNSTFLMRSAACHTSPGIV